MLKIWIQKNRKKRFSPFGVTKVFENSRTFFPLDLLIEGEPENQLKKSIIEYCEKWNNQGRWYWLTFVLLPRFWFKFLYFFLLRWRRFNVFFWFWKLKKILLISRKLRWICNLIMQPLIPDGESSASSCPTSCTKALNFSSTLSDIPETSSCSFMITSFKFQLFIEFNRIKWKSVDAFSFSLNVQDEQ